MVWLYGKSDPAFILGLVLGPGLVTALCRVRRNGMQTYINLFIHASSCPPCHLLTQCTGATLNQYNQPPSEQPHPALLSPPVTTCDLRWSERLLLFEPYPADLWLCQSSTGRGGCAVVCEQEAWFHLLLCVFVSGVCVVKRASGDRMFASGHGQIILIWINSPPLQPLLD